MNPPYMDPFDLGLEDVSKYPECAACRKKSDGAKVAADGMVLCGTHFDEYLAALFPKSQHRGESPAEFAARLRRDRYAACWTAKPEGGLP